MFEKDRLIEHLPESLEKVNIVLFTEIITLLLVLIPSNFLSIKFILLLFYLLLLSYFMISLFVPWIVMFYIELPNMIWVILLTSLISFLIYLMLSFIIKIPLQIIIYFILLKSFMSGIALFFKVVYGFIFPSRKKIENFSFTSNSTKIKQAASLSNQYLIGASLFFIIYPLFIFGSLYLYISL